MSESIPNFSEKSELEELLDADVHELDEDTRLDVQLYKSRKLKAKRDAGVSDQSPGWKMQYPGTVQSENGGSPDQPDEDRDKAEDSGDSGSGTTDRAPMDAEDRLEYYHTVKSRVANETEETSSDSGTASSAGSTSSQSSVTDSGESDRSSSSSSTKASKAASDEIAALTEEIRELKEIVAGIKSATDEISQQVE